MKTTHKLLALISILIFSIAINKSVAQNNSLYFDGINDSVSVPAASALIVNNSQISIACWIYATNAAPTYPNYDGFAGIRNDDDADFYMVQFSNGGQNSLEARFRNSTGTAYDIVIPYPVINTWIHYAFTYDGDKLRLYKNGVVADSLFATGMITNSTGNFSIGNINYTDINGIVTQYFLAGKADEVGLWNKTLSANEVNCLYHGDVDLSSPNLKLFYRCDQGTASGINTGLTSLIDASGHINGNLSNFALTGATSNYVSGASYYTTQAAFICQGSVYNFNGTFVTSSGIYMDTLTTTLGCDSLIQLTLTVLPVDTAVSFNANILTANHAGLTYQWLDCNNGYAQIPGETGQSFAPPWNGNYALKVTQGSCTDTSNCHLVTTVGITEQSGKGGMFVYPATGTSWILEFNKVYKDVQIRLMDLNGRVIRKIENANQQKIMIDLGNLPISVYMLEVQSSNERKMFRITNK